MALHIARDEYEQRQEALRTRLTEAGLDGILLFRQESLYYLTGFDTFGYVYFQCAYLGVDGTLTLLTRRPDLLQAQLTSTITDIRVWVDRPDASPADDLRAILEEHGCRGRRLGVEMEAYGLTARNWRRLEAALDGVCTLEDASLLVTTLRLVKSPAEIAFVRRAAALADDALDVAESMIAPGADEGAILGAMHNAIFAGGGDDPANEFIIGSGDHALLCRYQSGRRTLGAEDQITLEFAGTYRHYHSCLMRTYRVGPVPPRQQAMHDAAVEAMAACLAAIRPGTTFGAVFDAHARVLDAAGFGALRMNACGYSLGAVFAPNWMDWPMLFTGNPVDIQPGMVIFLHMILADGTNGLAAMPGQTVLTTETGCEVLSRKPLALQVPG